MKKTLINKNFTGEVRASVVIDFTPEVCLEIIGGRHPVCGVKNGSFGKELEFILKTNEGNFMLSFAENSMGYGVDYDQVLIIALQTPHEIIEEQTRHFVSKCAVFVDGTKVALSDKIITKLPSIASEQWRAGREYIESL